MDHARWMHRCLQLARNGAGLVAPNPLVGAVLVQGEAVLGEGWHRAHGGAHAEVECLRNFGEGEIPKDAVLYVSLEPCAHTGLTPPCADLLIARGIRSVVIGCADPDPRVAGKGIAQLREAGVDVTVDVLREACRWQNRRFFISVEEQRPYIILKWARSIDGFLDQQPRTSRDVQRISCFATDVLVHRWRSEEAAILVGSRTVMNDNPQLNVRHVAGRSPLRVVLDREGITPADSNVYDGSIPTLLFTGEQRAEVPVEQVVIGAGASPLPALLAELHRRRIRSVLVEGGGELLQHFVAAGLWDEVREIVGEAVFGNGTPAPKLPVPPQRSITSGTDRLHFATRHHSPDAAWPW
ncbi:MAG: bifunctional diaminohydroxyphosphoribosylaminopyrimidine deaminase/5-amino-6-(5-phosphoribosylamino)uracil reductase RibD [Flavobacteriales bacterium]